MPQPTSTQHPPRTHTRQHADHQFDQASGKVVHRAELPSPEAAKPLPVLPRSIGKATLDYVCAPTALVMLLPVFVVMAIYIKVVSRGPVFFRHQRFGAGELPFRVWKFRTMSVKTDPADHARYVQSLVDGNALLNKTTTSELIPFGALIRDLGIDEMPQLLNVLAGQMSLVGPRPDVFEPSKLSTRQRVRYQVLPGITGLWQISGKNNTTFEEMINLDVSYVNTQSLATDLQVMLATPMRILTPLLPWKSKRRD